MTARLSRTSTRQSYHTGLNSGLAGFSRLSCSMSYKNRLSTIENQWRDYGSSSSTTSTTSSTSNNSPPERSQYIAQPEIIEEQETYTKISNPIQTCESIAENKCSETDYQIMQTRRALRRMCLSLGEDDEIDDRASFSESETDEQQKSFQSNGSFLSNSNSFDSDANSIYVSERDLKEFTTRLRQLEDICHRQAEKQAELEKNIEIEVRKRTKHIEAQLQEKSRQLELAQDFDMDREIERRFTDFTMSSTRGSSNAGKSKSKPLSALFRSKQSTKQKELEQFKEFLQQSMPKQDKPTATAVQRDLTDSFFAQSSQNELIEMVELLRGHIKTQDEQIEQAKQLITMAIAAREEAESTAREAVDLTLELDSRLDRASQEIVEIKDELRRSTMSMSMSMLSNVSQPEYSRASTPRRQYSAIFDNGRR